MIIPTTAPESAKNGRAGKKSATQKGRTDFIIGREDHGVVDDDGEAWGLQPSRVKSFGQQRRLGETTRMAIDLAANGGKFFGAHGEAIRGPDGQVLEDYAEAQGGFGTLGLLKMSLELAGQERALRPYAENPYLRSAIKAIKGGFEKLRYSHWTGEPEDRSATEVTDGPGAEFLRLLRSPHPQIPASELWRRHAVNHALDGEVFWFFADRDGNPIQGNDDTGEWTSAPAQLLPVRGSHVLHEEDDSGFVKSYRYQRASQRGATRLSKEEFPWYSVVGFTDYDPDNENRGLGDAQAVIRAIDLHHQILRYMDGALEAGGQPGGIIIYKNQVDPVELQRREEEATEKLTEPNRGRYWMLDGDARFFANNIAPKDMEYVQLWDAMTQVILSGLGVPPPVVGLYDDATLTNVDAAHLELWRGSNGILSRADAQTQTIQEVIFWQRAARVWPGIDQLVPRFDHSRVQVLQQDKADQVRIAKDTSEAGIGVSFHEALEIMGCEHHATEHGDKRWVKDGLSEIDDAGMIAERGKGGGEGEEEGAPGDDDAAAAKEDNAAVEGGNLERSARLQERLVKVYKAYGRDAVKLLRRLAREPKQVAQGDDAPESILDKPADWIFERRVGWIEEFAAAQRRFDALPKCYGLDDPLSLAQITDDEFDELLLEEAPWTARFDRDTRVVLRDLFLEAALAAQGSVGGPIMTKSHPSALRFNSRQVIRLSEGASSSLSKRVRNLIAKVLAGADLENGVTLREAIRQELPTLTAELERVFGTPQARAATIAQTETGIAENGGRYEQFGAAGVEEVEWQTSRDSAVRPTHARNHGVRRRYGVQFPNGLLYPHDPAGAAGEVINCRCTFRATKFKNPAEDTE